MMNFQMKVENKESRIVSMERSVNSRIVLVIKIIREVKSNQLVYVLNGQVDHVLKSNVEMFIIYQGRRILRLEVVWRSISNNQ